MSRKTRRGNVNSMRIKSASFNKNSSASFTVKNQNQEEVKLVIKREGFIYNRNPYRYEKVEEVQKFGRKNAERTKFFIFLNEGDDIEFEIGATEKSENNIERFEKHFFGCLRRIFLEQIQKMKNEIKQKETEIEESKQLKDRIIEDTEERFMKKFREEDQKLTIEIVKEFSPKMKRGSGISKPIEIPEYASDVIKNNNEVIDDEDEREFYMKESQVILDKCLGKFESIRSHLRTETTKILEKKRDDLLSFQSAQSLAWARSIKLRENDLILKDKQRRLEELQNHLKAFKENILGK